MALYEIRVKGQLDPHHWREWFGVGVEYAAGVTTLRGQLDDQAAIYGLLSRLRDAAAPLLSVELIGPDDDS